MRSKELVIGENQSKCENKLGYCIKVASPEESGHIVARENVHFSFKKKIKKQRAQSLRMKMRHAELYLEVSTVIYDD